MSGRGAARRGGRFNPPGVNTIYLGQPDAVCLAEYQNMLDDQGLTRTRPGAFLLHTMQVRELEVLDLTQEVVRDRVSLSLDDVIGDSHDPCQAVGRAAHYLKIEGIVAPSARADGLVIAVFEDQVDPGQLTPILRARAIEDLTSD